MKKLFVFVLFAELACFFCACDDFVVSHRLENGKSCNDVGKVECQDGLAYMCEDYTDSTTKWYGYQCEPDKYCKSYGDISGCWRPCDSSMAGQVDRYYPGGVCTELKDGSFFYVN